MNMLVIQTSWSKSTLLLHCVLVCKWHDSRLVWFRWVERNPTHAWVAIDDYPMWEHACVFFCDLLNVRCAGHNWGSIMFKLTQIPVSTVIPPIVPFKCSTCIPIQDMGAGDMVIITIKIIHHSLIARDRCRYTQCRCNLMSTKNIIYKFDSLRQCNYIIISYFIYFM